MSGIFGLYNAGKAYDVSGLIERLEALPSPSGTPQRTEIITRGPYLLGRRHLGTFQQPDLPGPDDPGPFLMTTGYCLSDDAITLGWSPRQVSWALDILSTERHERLADLNGSFQCAHLDADNPTLHLFNDRFGLKPLFIFDQPPCFAFAAEIEVLLLLIAAAQQRETTTLALDRVSVAEWLELGFLMRDRTLFQHVSVLPAASVLFHEGNRQRLSRYWVPRYADENRSFDSAAMAERIDRAIRQSVQQRLKCKRKVAVSLSGGLDSRLLLAAVVKEGLPVTAITFGPNRSDDHVIAAEVTTSLDIPHVHVYDQPQSAIQYFDMGVRRTAGMANVLNFWGVQHGPEICNQTDYLINGIGGNELLGFLAFDLLRFAIPRSVGYLNHWLSGKFNPGWSDQERQLFNDELAPDTESLSARLNDYWRQCPATSAVGRIYHFLFNERNRRANALGFVLDDLFIEPLAPFLDNEVVDLALQIPPRQRQLARFYRYFLRTHHSNVAHLEYNRTGLPADVNTARLVTAKLRQTLMRGTGDAAEPWDRWLRVDLKDYVSGMLLDSGSRVKDLLPSGLVCDKTEAFLSGGPVPAMVIGQLLTLEIFLRTFRPVVA